MNKLIDTSTLRKGDKLLQVEYNQGLNGEVERMYANLVTVDKITKARVYILDDVYNIRFSLNKSAYNPDAGFHYGSKTEYYTQPASELGVFQQPELDCLPAKAVQQCPYSLSP